MKRSERIMRLALITCIVLGFAIEAAAQPDGGGGRGRGRRGGAARLRMMLPVEQTLSFLAFDGRIALKDNQLLEIRNALKEIHGKRGELEKEMQDGADRQQISEKLGRLRSTMFDKVKVVLDDSQDKVLDGYLERMRRGFQRGRGGGGRRGGGV